MEIKKLITWVVWKIFLGALGTAFILMIISSVFSKIEQVVGNFRELNEEAEDSFDELVKDAREAFKENFEQ